MRTMGSMVRAPPKICRLAGYRNISVDKTIDLWRYIGLLPADGTLPAAAARSNNEISFIMYTIRSGCLKVHYLCYTDLPYLITLRLYRPTTPIDPDTQVVPTIDISVFMKSLISTKCCQYWPLWMCSKSVWIPTITSRPYQTMENFLARERHIVCFVMYFHCICMCLTALAPDSQFLLFDSDHSTSIPIKTHSSLFLSIPIELK